jgi:hypothetical protein
LKHLYKHLLRHIFRFMRVLHDVQGRIIDHFAVPGYQRPEGGLGIGL